MDNEKMNLDAFVNELVPAIEEFVHTITQMADVYCIGRPQILKSAVEFLIIVSMLAEVEEESDGQYERVRATNR